MKTSTVALVVAIESECPSLIDILCDDSEIQLMETALLAGAKDALSQLYDQRAQLEKQENEFGDYVEELLSQPFLKAEVQMHGVQWFKSKIRIEQFQKSERQAAKIIADYAYKIFQSDPTKTDFFLQSSTHQVRIRIFPVEAGSTSKAA